MGGVGVDEDEGGALDGQQGQPVDAPAAEQAALAVEREPREIQGQQQDQHGGNQPGMQGVGQEGRGQPEGQVGQGQGQQGKDDPAAAEAPADDQPGRQDADREHVGQPVAPLHREGDERQHPGQYGDQGAGKEEDGNRTHGVSLPVPAGGVNG